MKLNWWKSLDENVRAYRAILNRLDSKIMDYIDQAPIMKEMAIYRADNRPSSPNGIDVCELCDIRAIVPEHTFLKYFIIPKHCEYCGYEVLNEKS